MHHHGDKSEQLILRALNNKYINYKSLTSLRCGSTCFSELLASCSIYSFVTHNTHSRKQLITMARALVEIRRSYGIFHDTSDVNYTRCTLLLFCDRGTTRKLQSRIISLQFARLENRANLPFTT